MSPTTRARLKTAVRLVGLVALVGFLVPRIDLAAIRASWRGLSPLAEAGVLAAWFASIGVRALRWHIQARGLGFTLAGPALAYDWALGQLFGLVTPGRVGELYRLRRLEGGVSLRGATAVAYEKSTELMGLALLSGVGAALSGWMLPAVGLLGAAVVGLGVLGSSQLPPAPKSGLLHRIAGPVFAARDQLPFNARVGVFATGLVSLLLNILAGATLYRAFGDVPWSALLVRLPMLTVAGALPITISGVGLRETIAMELFGHAGYPESAAAVVAATSFFGANLLPAAVLALGLGVHERYRMLIPPSATST